MNRYNYRIREEKSINKKGDVLESKFYVQKRFLFFFWIDVYFYDLYPGKSLISGACYVHRRKSFDDLIKAKLALKALEKFKSQKYEGKKIKLGTKYQEIIYFYDHNRKKGIFDNHVGIESSTIEGLKDYIDKNVSKTKNEYSYIIF